MIKKMVVVALAISALSASELYSAGDTLSVHIPIAPIAQEHSKPAIEQKDSHIELALERIHPERIATAQKNIARDMFINKWTRYTLRGASAALMVGAGYVVLKWLLARSPESVQAITSGMVTSAAEQAPQILTNEELTQRVGILEQLLNKPNPVFFSFDYWKRAATSARDYGIYLILAPLAVSRTNAAVDRVFINRDIGWFVIQQTTLASQLQALKHAAQTYADGHVQDYQQEFYNYVFPDVCSRAVKQIEMVLAFMQYTRDTLPQTAVEIKTLDLMIRYLHNCTDDMSKALEQFLNKQDPSQDKHQLEAIVTRFETEVHNTINRFKDTVQDILNQQDI